MKKYVLIALCCLIGSISAMAQNGLAADGWYEYTVSEGNLSELISESEKYQITKLRLKGKINGDDFNIIRDIAGVYISSSNYTEGKLEMIDLSNVVIVKGGYFHKVPLNYDNYIPEALFRGSKTLKEVRLGNVTWLGNSVFQDCVNLTTITGLENITKIGSLLFKGCCALRSISLPKLQDIQGASDVFWGCTSLSEVSCPELTQLNQSGWFYQCSSLRTINLPKISGMLASSTFDYCSSLEEISFPNVTSIEQCAFRGCTNLKVVNIPNAKSIGYACFENCTSLQTVSFPFAEKLGSNCFKACSTLYNAEFPKVTTVGSSAFSGCTSLQTITLPVAEIIEGSSVFYGCKSLKSISLPKAKSIGLMAFQYCDSLFSVSLDNVEYIEKQAFMGCKSLTSLHIPKVRYIGRIAFQDSKIEKISLPEIQSIGEMAFMNSMANVEIGEDIDTIGCYAFGNAEYIKIKSKDVPIIYPVSGTIPSSNGQYVAVEGVSDAGTITVPASSVDAYRSAEQWNKFSQRIIPDNVQTNCTAQVVAQESTSGLLKAIGEENLSYTTHLTINGTINSYDIMLMRNKMPNLHHLDLEEAKIIANPYEYYQGYHSEDHRIGGYMFADMRKLIDIKLPKNSTYIGPYAFYQCSHLRNLEMFPGITNIDRYAFSKCNALNKIEIPEGVLTIDTYAFAHCEELDSVIIDEGLRILGNAFFSCKNLKYIKLPNSVEQIIHQCFSFCDKLEEIDLPANLHTITGAAFMGCTSLKKIILPAKLREIGARAFERCTNLSEVHISPMVETIGDGAFDQCPNINNIYVYIANAKDIKINQNTFSSWTSSRLHVPNFAYDTYYWDTQWSQFAHLDEFDEKYESFYSKNTITLDKGTGTITGTPDATLHENGGLIVNDEEKQELDEIQLKSDGTNGATLIPENTGNIKAKKVDITIKVKGNKWHFFCFPFDVPLSGMKYEGEYVWRRYDGAKRSRREGGWQNLAAGTTTLEAGRGYIFQGTTDGELILSVENPEITASDVKTGLEVYPSDNSQDASWNFVGNPYVSYYSIDATTYSSPITIWNGTGYEAYRPGDDDYMFHPYQAFFVQTPVDASEIGFDATARESFEQSQTSLAAAKARRAARKINVNRLLVNLELFAIGDTAYMDKTRIVFNDKENMEYDAVSDAAKFMSSERAAEFYTLDCKNVQYAINERPMAGGDVRMGFIANKAGEYRIAQSRSDVEMLLVDHQEGITHNLGTGAYTFSSSVGTFDNRFTLKVNGQETGITELKEKTCIDLTVDGGLCINGAADEVTTSVYQLNGVLAGTINGNGSLRLPKGIYAVKVGLLTLKVQI